MLSPRAVNTMSATQSERPARAELRGFGWRPLGRRAPVISDLDLVIEPGERVLLAGPSGAGKSTVLRALLGVLGDVLPGDLAGEVTLDGALDLRIEDATGRATDMAALTTAFERLSVDHRHLLVMHHLHRVPVADLAKELGIPEGTTKWRLHAARAALARTLEADR